MSGDGEWTEDEQQRLEEALSQCASISDVKEKWKAVAKIVETRGAKSCATRFKYCREVALRTAETAAAAPPAPPAPAPPVQEEQEEEQAEAKDLVEEEAGEDEDEEAEAEAEVEAEEDADEEAEAEDEDAEEPAAAEPEGPEDACTRRWPIKGESVLREDGQKVAAGGWELQAGEEGIVVEMDKDGDFKLKNSKGATSRFFQPRRRFIYRDINYEAPPEPEPAEEEPVTAPERPAESTKADNAAEEEDVAAEEEADEADEAEEEALTDVAAATPKKLSPAEEMKAQVERNKEKLRKKAEDDAARDAKKTADAEAKKKESEQVKKPKEAVDNDRKGGKGKSDRAGKGDRDGKGHGRDRDGEGKGRGRGRGGDRAPKENAEVAEKAPAPKTVFATPAPKTVVATPAPRAGKNSGGKGNYGAAAGVKPAAPNFKLEDMPALPTASAAPRAVLWGAAAKQNANVRPVAAGPVAARPVAARPVAAKPEPKRVVQDSWDDDDD